MRHLAVICDFLEEQWTSMDFVADMLLAETARLAQVTAIRIRPRFRSCLDALFRSRVAFNADRLINRMWHYPRFLRRAIDDFDAFHVADHSYAHLVHGLPHDRTGVFCHDLDLFRCLLEPRQAPRPTWFKAMAARVLRGLARAAIVFYTTETVRRQIEHHGLVDSTRLVRAPLGVAPEFQPDPVDPEPAAPLIAERGAHRFLLNVGSTVPRKRMDVLLQTFAELRRLHPDLALIQIGGEWTAEQVHQIDRLRIRDRIEQYRGIDRKTLASLYRQAALVLLPSEREGFGIPLIEALACGSPVLASDIPVFREVGKDAPNYCPVGQIGNWVEQADRVLSNRAPIGHRALGLARAGDYSWTRHAEIVSGAYQRITEVR